MVFVLVCFWSHHRQIPKYVRFLFGIEFFHFSVVCYFSTYVSRTKMRSGLCHIKFTQNHIFFAFQKTPQKKVIAGNALTLLSRYAEHCVKIETGKRWLYKMHCNAVNAFLERCAPRVHSSQQMGNFSITEIQTYKNNKVKMIKCEKHGFWVCIKCNLHRNARFPVQVGCLLFIPFCSTLFRFISIPDQLSSAQFVHYVYYHRTQVWFISAHRFKREFRYIDRLLLKDFDREHRNKHSVGVIQIPVEPLNELFSTEKKPFKINWNEWM